MALADARQIYKNTGNVTVNLETLARLRAQLDWGFHCITGFMKSQGAPAGAAATSQQAPPSTSAAMPQQQQQQQSNLPVPQTSTEGFSREALLAGMKPGLRMEDLKPPVPKRGSLAVGDPPSSSSAQQHESPAKTPIGGEAGPSTSSPATQGYSPAQGSQAGGKPAKQPSTSGSAAGTPASGSAAGATKKGHAHSRSGTKFPTQNDIMAAVKSEMANKKGGAPSPAKQGSTAPSQAVGVSDSTPSSSQPAKRQQELEAAKEDPMPFLRDAWNELMPASSTGEDAGASAKQKDAADTYSHLWDAVSALSIVVYLCRGVLSLILPVQFVSGVCKDANPAIPQPTRDPADLSFVEPQPTLKELGASSASAPGRDASSSATNSRKEEKKPSTANENNNDFDWSVFLLNTDSMFSMEDDAAAGTPELDDTQSSQSTPPNKDEVETPETSQAQQTNGGIVAGAPIKSSASVKRKSLDSIDESAATGEESGKRSRSAEADALPSSSANAAAVFDLSQPDHFDLLDFPRADLFLST